MSAHSFVIPLRTPGLVKADFGFRYYRDGARVTGAEAAITATQINSVGDYLVAGLPECTRGQWATLTWEYPSGVGSSHAWPQQTGTPTAVIIPLRETGYVAADFALKLYRNGVEQSATLVTAMVGGTGDYRVTGWGTAVEGDQWLLTWQLAGITFSFPWVGAASTVTAPALRPFQRRARRMMSRLVRYFGEGMTVILRRRHSLVDDTDLPAATVTLSGDHAEGATTVTLTSTRLDGTLPPGLRLTLGGVPYEVGGESEIRSAGNLLRDVPLTAGLESAFTSGASVTVEASRDFTFTAMAGSRQSDFSTTTQPSATQTIAIGAEGAPTTPRPDDVVIVAGSPEDVFELRPVQPGDAAAGWVLVPRGRAA